MHSMFIDIYASLEAAFTDFTMFKVAVANIASFVFPVVVWYVILLKRKRIGDLLHKAEKEKPSSFEKFINYLVILSCSLPVILSIHLAISISATEESAFYSYGYDINNESAKFTIISIKSIIIYMVNPTYINTVALFYISLCLRCKTSIQYLNREIADRSPEDFTLCFQRNILRKRIKIYNLLLKIKDTFSLSVFFILIGHIAMCSGITGWLLVKQWDEADYYWKVETPYFAINSVLCVVSVLWVAGSIPVELNAFKETFYQKTHRRLLYFNIRDELFLKTDMFNEPEFEFSGCEMVLSEEALF
ncbi:uncharacterized protein TNIN_105681 [Trichonephila inaurata madagascariensis]|uniref:Uncharacterized protein n=1 Tax=Trichonephila inaurata madagascariensis TaxID=2747483 RepID=A0A8X6YXX4_9ARAC|nr:uncharacterized protein TNIN_105681 [Trichonephila inaurata madagascariensis]